MAKIKIYELAKELSVESKEIVRKLHKMGVDAKTHMSTISDKEAEAIRNAFAGSRKSNGENPLVDEGFVPRVKRIPKSVIDKQKTVDADEALVDQSAEHYDAKPDKPAVGAVNVAQSAAASDNNPVSAPEKPTQPTPTPSNSEKQKDQKNSQPGAADIDSVSGGNLNNKKAEAGITASAGLEKQMFDQVTVANKDNLTINKEVPSSSAAANTTPDQGKQSRPQGKGYQGNRDGQSRPQGQGYQGNRDGQSRPQGQGYQGNRDGQSRPQNKSYQGNRDGQSRMQDKDDDRDKQSRAPQSNKRNDKKTGAKAADSFLSPPEKPSTNYRPNNKKVFVKDIVIEKASEAENQRVNKAFRSNKNPKGGRGGKKDIKGRKEAKAIMPPVIPKKIIIGETVILGELAKTMGKTAAEIIKKLFTMGIMATINQELDSETAILLADEFGVTVEVKADKAAEIMEDIIDEDELLIERPPVVTIMGHVDHGKTSLLDAIRHTNVISTEAGGITQHIGAYQVEIKNRKITFLDTPGHEAFTAMRARGAQVTDISIIVVAADDGVMPQTVEAINHSKAAGVPIIIAINKIDKPGANPDKVKQELMEYGLVSEEWGGDTVMVPVSAKAKMNLEGLLEMILLVSEVAELKANPDRQARGTVVEAKLDKNRGPVATLLVQKGTLNSGDNILAGAVFGKVRAMTDDKGNKVHTAGPSMPVEVLGFSEVPPAGEIFIAVKDEKDARLVAARQQIKKREEELHKTARVSLDDLFKQIAEGDIQELNLVVKADVQGSVEALTQSLYKLNTDEVKVNVIHSGVGGVSESDVMLATASNAIILGFNIVAPPAARAAAEAENVDIRLYRVIYDALEDIKKAMSGLLAPEYKENIIGHAEVRAVFKVPKAGMVAGSYVTHGKITRNAKIRVIRDNIVISEDKVDSLRRFKDDAKEVLTGFECGIGLENFNDIKEGDILEAFIIEEIHREL